MRILHCLVVVLVCGAQRAFTMSYIRGMGGMDMDGPTPKVTYTCNANSQEDQRISLMLQEDPATLSQYFDTKCAELNSMCPAVSIATAQRKLCELERLKERLFPSNGQQPAMTRFDCGVYSPAELRGCPRPTPTASATNPQPMQNFGFNSLLGINRANTGTTTPLPVRNGWDRIINAKVAEYRDKMNAYRNIMRQTGQPIAAYPGVASYGGGYSSAYSSSSPAASSSMSNGNTAFFGGPQAATNNPSMMASSSNTNNANNGWASVTNNNNNNAASNAWAGNNNNAASNVWAGNNANNNGWSAAGFGTRQMSSPWSFNANAAGGRTTNAFSPSMASMAQPPAPSTSNAYSSGYGGSTNYARVSAQTYMPQGAFGSYGSFMPGGGIMNNAAQALLKQAQEIKRCLPPGSIAENMPYGLNVYPSMSEYSMVDPLKEICKLKENSKEFDKLEENIVKSFMGSLDHLCKDQRLQSSIDSETTRIIGTIDPESYIRNFFEQPLTLELLVIKKCAIKNLAKKLKDKDALTLQRLECNVDPIKTDLATMQQRMEAKKMMMEWKMKEDMGRGGGMSYPAYEPYEQDPLKKITKAWTCASDTTERDLMFRKLNNMKLAICAMNQKTSDRSVGYGFGGFNDFESMFNDYLKLQKKLFTMKPILDQQIQDNNANFIMNNQYASVVNPMDVVNGLQTPSEMLILKRMKLTTTNVVFNQMSSQCPQILSNDADARNFPAVVQDAVTGCQKGDKEAWSGVMKKAMEIMKTKNLALSLQQNNAQTNAAQNNRVAICLKYTMAAAIPSTGGSPDIGRILQKLAFAGKLMKMVKKETEKAKASGVALGNCDSPTNMNANSKNALDQLLAKIEAGDIGAAKDDMHTFLNPPGVTLTEAEQERYKACKALRLYQRSQGGTMCAPFSQAQSALTSRLQNTRVAYQQNRNFDLHQRFALDMMAPFQANVNQGVNQCTNTRNSDGSCPSGTCCPAGQPYCDNNQCVTPWQKIFCKKSAIAQGMSTPDEAHLKFMKMMKDAMKKQQMYSDFLKYTPTSPECTNLFNPSTTTTQGNTGQPAAAGFGGFGGLFGAAPTGAYGGASTRLTQAKNMLQTSSFSSGYGAYSSGGYGGGGGYEMPKPCEDQGRQSQLFCAWDPIYQDVVQNACRTPLRRNPLFPTYDYMHDYTSPYCDTSGNAQDVPDPTLSYNPAAGGAYFGGVGVGSYQPPPQKNRDCEVLTQAREDQPKTGYQIKFLVLLEYLGRHGGMAYGSGLYQSSSFGGYSNREPEAAGGGSGGSAYMASGTTQPGMPGGSGGGGRSRPSFP